MFTSETAPKGYIGPIRLTPEQRAVAQRRTDEWVGSLVRMAHDDSDPETQANAQLLLSNRGIAY